MKSVTYDYDWYMQRGGSRPVSVSIISKIVYELLEPKGVADIGCGIGVWLATFRELGVQRITGVDGEFIEKEWLQIPPENFIGHDLNTPLEIDEQFDLAICLEVAEHLKEASGVQIVKLLTKLAPVVMFSAAIPFQGGTGHINEQWASYWAKLFIDQGYVPVDYLRSLIWTHPDIPTYYKQNILFYIKEDELERYPALKANYDASQGDMLDVIHPGTIERIHVRQALKLLRRAVSNAIAKRVNRQQKEERAAP